MAAVPGVRRMPAGLASRLPRWLTAEAGRAIDVAVLVLVVGYLVVLVPGLTRWPPLINDEGREANLFWVASGADPTAERMNAYRGFATWGTGGLQGATAAAIFRLAGVGVLQARLTSLLWGGLLLLVVYWLGRRYWNRAVGLTATALLAVSNPFLLSSHTLRPDIQVVTMVLGALLLAERAVAPETRRPLLPALLAGLVLGLVLDTHLNGAAFFPLVGLVFPLRLGWRRFLTCRVTWLFVAGIAVAGLYFISVRMLPDPPGYLAAMGYWLGVDKAPPVARGGNGGLGGMLANELARYWDYFGEEPAELGLILAGLAGGAWMAVRGSHPARLIWLGLLAAFAFFVVAVSMKSRYYMLLTYPLYLLLLARVVERAATWLAAHISASSAPGPPDGRAPGRAGDASLGFVVQARAAAILTALVVLSMLWPLKLEERTWDNYIRARRYREGQEYTQLTDRLRELAGPGAKIMAPPVYWIGLQDHPYVDIFVYERVERQYGMTPAQFLDETRPDIVITDAKIATDRRVERLLYNELDRRAPYELIVRHKNYGDVAIYRLRW